MARVLVLSIARQVVGPAACSVRRFSAGTAPDADVLALGKLSTQTIVDALWLSNYPQPYIHGARPMRKGMTCAGRAVTLRFVPHRPDIAADKPQGVSLLRRRDCADAKPLQWCWQDTEIASNELSVAFALVLIRLPLCFYRVVAFAAQEP
jgi:hypothetical protein